MGCVPQEFTSAAAEVFILPSPSLENAPHGSTETPHIEYEKN